MQTSFPPSARAIGLFLMAVLLVSFALPAWSAPAPRAGNTYWVDGSATNASDSNTGAVDQPWKTLRRAGSAPELQPGDTVLVRSGVYREHFAITVSGAPDRPITFAAAPNAKVLIKGSEVIKGQWERVSEDPDIEEPYPNAFRTVWRIQLGEPYFVDDDFPNIYKGPGRRKITQVFATYHHPLQRIGPDPLYLNEPYNKLQQVGNDLSDLIDNSFWLDPTNSMLYVRMSGAPSWYVFEIGARGWVLTVRNAHDVIVRGFDVLHNRMPGGSWPMASVSQCERVIVEDCSFTRADFCGLSVGTSTNCVIRRCDLSYNGNTGISLSKTVDVTVEDCTIMFNNYRHFHAGWHAGGMKSIPGNVRATVRRCEAAYNIASPGLWFDDGNRDIRLLDNICHHNGADGIFFEINPGGGLIAGNLCYANQGRGIYNSGSSNTWIVHNTVVENAQGIVVMPQGEPYPVGRVYVYNNLILGNSFPSRDIGNGTDLILFTGTDGRKDSDPPQTKLDNHSDYNVYAAFPYPPNLRHTWNPNNSLAQWRERFGEDLNSKELPITYALRGTGFQLLTQKGLNMARRLPDEVTRIWKPQRSKRVGANYTQWP